jgi:hypothetical protein
MFFSVIHGRFSGQGWVNAKATGKKRRRHAIRETANPNNGRLCPNTAERRGGDLRRKPGQLCPDHDQLIASLMPTFGGGLKTPVGLGFVA